MRNAGARVSRVTQARLTRSVAALALALGVSCTGLVAIAVPAHALTPAPVLDSPATVTSADPSPVVAFHAATPGAPLECSTSPQGVPATSWTPCAEPSATFTGLGADGHYDLAVREISPTNDGLAAVVDYTLDRVADLSVLAPASPGNDTTPTWTLSGEPSSTFTCAFDGAPADPCGGTFTPAAALTTERGYDLVVVATDAVGNVSSPSTTTYTLDTTAPGAPTVTGSAGTGNDTSPSWSWSNPDGDTALCTLDAPGGPGPEGACTSGTSHTATVSAEGDYSVAVVLQDAAGNRSAAVPSPTYTLDTTAPTAPSFTAQPSGTGTLSSATWSFTTPGASTTCVLKNGTTLVSTFACDSGTTTQALTADGSWTLTVSTDDGVGNVASTTSAAYLRDTTGPTATVTGPTGLSNVATPHVTWSGEMPSTATCRWERTVGATVTYGSWTACDANYYDPTLPGDGSYRFQVQVTDPLGNAGPIATSAGSYDYDATPPAAPVLTTPMTPGNDTTPTVSWPLTDAAACVVASGTTLPGSPAGGACTSASTWTPTLTGDGSWTLGVRLTDAAGNIGPAAAFTYVLDSVGPTPVTFAGPTGPSKAPKPTWTLTSDGSSTLTCRVLKGSTVIATPSCSTSVQADLSAQADGSYVIEVTATDAAGNTAVSTLTYVLDTTKPLSPTVTGPASPGNAANPTWTFAPQANTTAACRLVQGLSTSAWSDCSGGSYTVTGIADGTYTVEVVVSDVAGNAADPGVSAPYTSDRTAPAAPAVSGPSGPGKTAAVTWSWTGESGVTATCRLDRNGVIGSATACSTGSFSPTLTGDASYVVVVTLTDAAGNPSPATTTASYDLDTVAPAAPTVTGPTGTGSTTSATWTWTVPAGATSGCVLVRDGVAGAAAACTSGTAVSLPADGAYQLQVTLTDAAGNASPAGTSGTYVLDTVAPVAPTVTTPASPSSSRTPSFTFVAESGTTTECRWRQGTSVVADWATCTSPHSPSLTSMPDADYTLDVRATDAAGNVGAAGSSLPYRLDTVAPTAPVVSVPTGPSTVTTPTITWTGEAGASASCVLALDGTARPATACSTPWQPTLVGDGSWDVTVTLSDAAGNTSPSGTGGPYVLDTTPPPAPVLTTPASPSSVATPIWSATLGAGDTAECQLTSGATVLVGWAACTFPWTSDLTGRPDGVYTVSVRAVDGVGLLSTPVSGSYTFDTSGPAGPVVTGPSTPGTTTAPVFSFTAESGSTTTCAVTSGATVVTAAAPCTSPVTVDLSSRTDGPYTVTVTATDVAGNVGAPSSATYVLDRAAPAAPVLTASPASPSPVTSPSWSFTAEAGAVVTCTLSGATVGPVASTTCTSPFTATLATDDTYTLTVTATDAAGNTGAALTTTYVLDTSAPVAPTLTPPASPSQSTTPTWGVSTPEGRVECQLTQGSTVVVPWTTCTTGFTPALTGSDGTYVLTARTIDAAGNTSSAATSSYVLDRVAPAPASLSTPPSPATNRAPVWTVTGSEGGLTATCTLTGPTGPVVSGSACTADPAGSTYVADLSSAADGSYTLTVTLTDAAGNASTATSAAYVLDTTVPTAVLVTAPPTPGNALVVTWGLTGDTDATLECSFTKPATPATPFAACPGAGAGSGSYTANLAGEPDGTYTLTVRALDAAGNVGPATPSAYLLDTVAPPAPTGLRAALASPSNVPAVTWSFGVEAGATGLCQLLSATAVVTQEADCSSPYVTDLSGLPDGVYSLTVRAKDAAGNLGPHVSADYTFDRTAPGGPVVTKTPGSPSPILTPVWNVERSEASAQLQCRLVGLPGSDWAACNDPVTYDLSPATSGTYTLELREVDAAGNTSVTVAAPVYVLDSNAPVPPEVSPPAQSPDNSTTPVFTISHGAGAATDEPLKLTCTVTRFDGKAGTASPCDFGKSTVSLTGVAPRTQGLVSLSVLGTDPAGNVSGTATASYLYDSIPPPPAQIRPLASDTGTSPKVTWSFGETASAALVADGYRTASLSTGSTTFACQLTRAGTGPSTAKAKACTSPHTELLTQTGTWSLWVYAVDPAGNFSTPVSSRYTFTSPVPAVTDLRTPSSSAGSRPTWTFTVPFGYTAVCILSNGADAVLAQSTCSSGRYTGDLSGQPHGPYTVTVQLLDNRGTEGPYTRSTPYSYKAAAAGAPTVERPGPGASSGGPGSGSAPPTTFPRRNPPVPAPALPSTPAKTPAKAFTIPQPGGIITSEVPKAIGNTLKQVAQKPTIPLVLLGVVIGFLLLQNQIDRRDPKLASAPVGAEPELDFGPVQDLRGSTDRTTRPHRPLGGGAPA